MFIKFEEFINESLNEAKKELTGVNTWGHEGLNNKFTKVYKKLSKPVDSGKNYKFSYKDGRFTFKFQITVDHIISNDVKKFQMDSENGYYKHNEMIFIKDLGLFKVSDKKNIPAEYHQYL